MKTLAETLIITYGRFKLESFAWQDAQTSKIQA